MFLKLICLLYFLISEWTIGLTKFMKEQLNKVQEHYHGSTAGPVMSFLTATQAPSQVDLDLALKQWHYCSRLARHMYDVCILFYIKSYIFLIVQCYTVIDFKRSFTQASREHFRQYTRNLVKIDTAGH